jgi:hypothetical protein
MIGHVLRHGDAASFVWLSDCDGVLHELSGPIEV